MVIDGKQLASEVVTDLKAKVAKLKQNNITPKITIVTVGAEGTWKAYVGQKIKMAEQLEVKHELVLFQDCTEQTLLEKLKELNNDTSVHGIIVQRPFGKNINADKVVETIKKEKDIDGFRSDSPYDPPIYAAVEYMLIWVAKQNGYTNSIYDWLKTRQVTVVGKGEAGGRLIIQGLNKHAIKPSIIDSKTQNPEQILKNSDIIISAVGRSGIINAKDLKKGVVLIGIGMRREADGKLYGDYDVKEIESIASFYSPIPGGVGPVNVAFLYNNLIESAFHTLQK